MTDPSHSQLRRVGPAASGGDGEAAARFARVVAACALVVFVAGSLGMLRVLDVSDPAGPTGSDIGALPSRPAPGSSIVTPAGPDRPDIRGTILFVRAGQIWAASGTTFARLTSGPADSFPIWSADARRIFLVETRQTVGEAPYQGVFSKITLDYPVLMSIASDGSDRQSVLSSLISLRDSAKGKFFFQIVQPDLNPDGTRFVLSSDAIDPLAADVSLGLLDSKGGKVRSLGLRNPSGQGENDPAWSPDGRRIAYTQNAGDGGAGKPTIAILTVSSRAVQVLDLAGYANPDWSPDGRHLVAESTDGKGRDLAIIDLASGRVVRRLTSDGGSFAPTFSPDGRQIAYLRVVRQSIDLRMLTLRGDGSFTPTQDEALTADRLIDARSALSWSTGADPATPRESRSP